MATRSIEDVERDLIEIFGDLDEAEVRSPYHDSELIQIRELLNEEESCISSDEENHDADEIVEEIEETSDEENEDNEEHVAVDASEEWTMTRPPISSVSYSREEVYNIPVGAQTPYDFFKLLFDVSILSEIIAATNECGRNLLAQANIGTNSRIKVWKDTNLNEFLKFLGILFHFGNVKLNRYSDYWKKHYLFNLFPGNHMSRNRFLLIMRCLRFGVQNLETLIAYFNKKMIELYTPGEEICIDESMISSRGRSGIRQFIKGKRHKYGIKIYMLAVARGLALQIHMYKGKRDEDVGGQGHTDKVVAKLIRPYLNKGHHVYMDNFYNSISLCEYLLQNKTNVTGTLKLKRKRNPIIVTGSKLRKGGSIFRYNRKGVCVCKWKDQRDVLSISTKHSPLLVPTLNKRGQNILKPEMVVSYNKYMCGVDRQDQMMSYYSCEHKSMRWYKKVGIHILQMMFLNAYYLYNRDKNINYYDFRLDVITKLLPPPSPPVTTHDKNLIHLPSHLPKDDKGNTKRRRCKHCWDTKKVRKNTLCFCPNCPTSPGLCMECFRSYHKY